MRWRRLSPLAVRATARAAVRVAARTRRRTRDARAAREAADAFALLRLILRDHLAVERTQMANERTVLSYLRTALAFLAGALTLVHLYGTAAAQMSAVALAAASVAMLGVGAWRFRTVRQRVHLHSLRGDPPAAALDAAVGERTESLAAAAPSAE